MLIGMFQQQRAMEDSDDGMNDDFNDSDELVDEGDEEEDEEENVNAEYIIGIEPEPSSRPKGGDDEYVHEVLTMEKVVELMQDIIRDVNTVVEVTITAFKLFFHQPAAECSRLICDLSEMYVPFCQLHQ